MYENFGLAKNSKKLKILLKTIFLENDCTKFHGNVRAIKPKLNRIEPNCFTFFPMTL